MIQEKIDKLKPYFKGIKVAENFKIVEFNLKKGWDVNGSEEIDLQQREIKENSNFLYNMFYSESKNFDEILDYVKKNIIDRNLEIEQKEELLRMKVEELKRVFEDSSLDELNNLKFMTEDNSLKLNSNNISKKEKINNNGTTKEFSTNS
jgi:hypothetical protein